MKTLYRGLLGVDRLDLRCVGIEKDTLGKLGVLLVLDHDGVVELKPLHDVGLASSSPPKHSADKRQANYLPVVLGSRLPNIGSVSLAQQFPHPLDILPIVLHLVQSIAAFFLFLCSISRFRLFC